MQKALIHDLSTFISKSPTSWHAVEESRKRLLEAGFHELNERNSWTLETGGKYFTTRNGSSLCAFVLPRKAMQEALFLGSHTDSPALKLKPQAEKWVDNTLTWTTEVYGGPVLPSWLNRELALAGKVILRQGGKTAKLSSHLVHINQPLAVIPHLAIHLEKSLGNELKVDRQSHLPALVHLGTPQKTSLLEELLKEQLPKGEILSSELYLIPYQEPSLTGPERELLSSGRLDNLLSVHACLAAFLKKPKIHSHRLSCFITWDNEEVGSATAQGAESSFLGDVLGRLHEFYGQGQEEKVRFRQSSLLISVDAAHAIHPNFVQKHDENHRCFLGKGPVIKLNAQQRYATDAPSSAAAYAAAQDAGIPIQSFVMRTDMPCGSTIGPIVATQLGLRTLDIGAPILSMHGIRELGACEDHEHMVQLMHTLLNKSLDDYLVRE